MRNALPNLANYCRDVQLQQRAASSNRDTYRGEKHHVNHWKSIGALAAGATFAISAAAGVQGVQASGEPFELDVMVAQYSDKTQPFWEELIGRFTEANPDVTVNLEVVSWDQINDVITTRVQSGDQPDVLNIDAYSTFAADGLLRPADEVLSAETIADIIPSFAENASIDGVQYGIPFIASSRALFYNTALFEEAGIEAPPETWQELRDAAQAITDAGHIGYAMPLGPEEAQAESAIWMYGNGGGWVDEEGNFAIDQDANVEAFEFMAALVADGLTQPNPATTDRADALNLFYEGEVGMIEGLVQTPVTIAADYPDLEYAVTASPHNEGAEPAALGVADHFMVFNNEGNEAAAGAFLDFFYQADNYASFIVSEGFLPVTTSGGEAAMPEFPEELTPFIEALPGARFYPSSNPAWGGVQGYVQQNIGLAVEGDDPASVLADVQAEAEALAEEAAG
jgi:multiple sugar transport system substrate-binding protein